MLAGTAYGVALNDRAERDERGAEFAAKPYDKAPVAPVLYLKPRNCFVPSGSRVVVPAGVGQLVAAATIGLLFGSAATRPSPADALGHVAGICLVLDVFEPHASYHRPAIRERCRDGFLPIGDAIPFEPEVLGGDIETIVDGEIVHRWSPDRLVRDCATLVADVGAFMTLGAGDLLLVGVPFDAPLVASGARVSVHRNGLPSLDVAFVGEGA